MVLPSNGGGRVGRCRDLSERRRPSGRLFAFPTFRDIADPFATLTAVQTAHERTDHHLPQLQPPGRGRLQVLRLLRSEARGGAGATAATATPAEATSELEDRTPGGFRKLFSSRREQEPGRRDPGRSRRPERTPSLRSPNSRRIYRHDPRPPSLRRCRRSSRRRRDANRRPNRQPNRHRHRRHDRQRRDHQSGGTCDASAAGGAVHLRVR